MGFLMPKVKMPAPPPPPPPPPSVPTPVVPEPTITQPDPVVRPNTVVDATRREMTGERAQRKANMKTSVKTSSRGVLEDAPLQYASLLGGSKRTKNPGDA